MTQMVRALHRHRTGHGIESLGRELKFYRCTYEIVGGSSQSSIHLSALLLKRFSEANIAFGDLSCNDSISSKYIFMLFSMIAAYCVTNSLKARHWTNI